MVFVNTTLRPESDAQPSDRALFIPCHHICTQCTRAFSLDSNRNYDILMRPSSHRTAKIYQQGARAGYHN